MQGIWIVDNPKPYPFTVSRPKSKKQVRELVRDAPERVIIEATSLYGNEPEGDALNLPNGTTVLFVGPDPYTKRNFYGQLIKTTDGRLVVK